MTFEDIVDQAQAMLQRRGRVTYRTLKRQFNLDDDAFEDLKDELLYAQPHVVDDDGRGLVWTGEAHPTPTPGSPPAVDQARAPRPYPPPYLAEKILTSKTAVEGERKQVTVLFADVRGSMELLADRDPEEARQLLDPVLERMMAAVHRYEGTVNQVMGDGIMALFGAPIALEDHAVRACYAALAMQASVKQYATEVQRSHGVPLQIRVGLNSGEVVVRAIGNDLHMDYSAIGQTTHLAARMEQMAMPGSILLTAETLRPVEGLVQGAALGLVPVKGMAESVEVYELMGATGVRRRLQAAAARGLTRFVGRQTELEALCQALERAGRGQGQLVAVVGEPGVGKSRLVYEFLHSHHTQGWLVLESASMSYGRATPYFPVTDLLKRYTHVEERDDARTVRAKVTGQVLTLDDTLQETLPALLSLLDALPENSPFAQLDPSQRRQRTLEALKRVLLRESQAQPLVLVFEDLHWIDSETQALLDSLVASLPTARLLLLVNYRPEYQHGWGSKTYYTQLRLDPLPPVSADEFLRALLGGDPSLAPLTHLLIARTEGNPFFLEESVRTLVETGVLVGEPGAYRPAHALPTVQVPATVQAVLAARIDRLPAEEKRLLQAAAVIGTDVPLTLLQAIAECREELLHLGLAHLQAAEFLYETRLFPEINYTFKHGLTHQVAYESLLQERRRALHARIVEALEALTGDRLAEQVERLAHHALRGEVWDKALAYFRQAGEKALARSAHPEAVGYFEQALSALPHLPETRDTREQAIDLRLALRSALFASGDSRPILVYLQEAEALAATLDDHRRLAHISGYLSAHFRNIGAYDRAIAAAQRALSLAAAAGDASVHALASLHLGAIYWAQSDYRQAIDCLGQTVTSLQGAERRERLGQVSVPSVQALAFLATCHAEQGRFAEGAALGEEGMRIAEAVAHPSSLMWASYGIGFLALRQGDLPKALPLLERAMRVCREADLPVFVPRLAAALGAAYTLAGRTAEAIALLLQAMERTIGSDMAGFQALCRLPLGETHLLAGRFEEAQTLAECALSIASEQQERGNEAYALRLLGAIAARRDPPAVAGAQSHYHQALALAEELGMRPLVAHCHLGLGRLYGQTGRAEPARAALTAAIDLYHAMEMTFWLPQAEVALAEVKGC
jgi:class 3 adenylate cyclase/tetratricopeptide (TPR) repeat protein